MSQENPTWGVPRIKSELALLGYEIAESTVAKYMPKQKKPPSQIWKTFLLNHAGEIAAIDFFTMPTVTYRIFYVFAVLRHSVGNGHFSSSSARMEFSIPTGLFVGQYDSMLPVRDFSKPGKYTAQWNYRDYNDRFFADDACWRGKLVSNEIQFEIVK